MMSEKLLGRFVFFGLLLLGIYLLPGRVIGPEFDGMPGDLGDTRFNNYILEHGHRYLCGKEDYFWGAPFFYPEANAITYSDNLLGVVPVYSVFRFLGCDRETAFQWFFIAICILNFLSAFFMLKKWSGDVIAASIGAWLFAFGLPVIAQINHIQLLPRFFAPIAIVYLLLFLQSLKWQELLVLCLAVVGQFYGSMYLGFLLVLILFVIVLVHLFYQSSYKQITFSLLKNNGLRYALVLAGSAILVFPLVWKYYQRSKEIGMRPWEEVEPLLPRLQSFVYPGNGTALYSFLEGNANGLQFPWEHVIFPGVLAVLALLTWPFFSRITRTKSDANGNVLFISFFIICLLFLSVGGFTMYKFIYKLPGYGSMRAPVRFMLLLLFFFSVFITLWVKELRKKKNGTIVLGVILLFMPMDQLVKQSNLIRHSKAESMARIAPIISKANEQQPEKWNAMVWFGAAGEDPNLVQLDGMLAAQSCGMKTVNGYSSSSPSGYWPFWVSPGEETLRDWLKFKGYESDSSKILILRP